MIRIDCDNVIEDYKYYSELDKTKSDHQFRNGVVKNRVIVDEEDNRIIDLFEQE